MIHAARKHHPFSAAGNILSPAAAAPDSPALEFRSRPTPVRHQRPLPCNDRYINVVVQPVEDILRSGIPVAPAWLEDEMQSAGKTPATRAGPGSVLTGSV